METRNTSQLLEDEQEIVKDLIEFQPEPVHQNTGQKPPWRILAVDDDRDYQLTTAFAMDGLEILGRPIVFVQAYSMAEASTLLAEGQDFGVILLDVVMETDNAGLRLVKAVREVLGNDEIRIVLLTGQPGMAPIRDVMREYDINEYWIKSELTTSRLISILTSELRTYEQLKTISTARHGLQLIIESSNRLVDKHDLAAYCDAVLTEIALLLGLDPEGVVCARTDQIYGDCNIPVSINKVVIVGAAGKLRSLIGLGLDSLPDAYVMSALSRAIREQSDIELDDATILFFSQQSAGADFVIYLPTNRPLMDTERQLLRVFATNISGGLHNVALVSRLERLAYCDNLLQIPNKNALVRAIDRALLSDKKSALVLLIVDLDDFGRTNHTFGIHFGDALLRRFSQRLCTVMTPPALVARIGDDVFGIMGSRDHVTESVVRGTLARPFEIEGTLYSMSTCISSVALDSIEGSARDAIRLGHLALKEAKRQGPGSTLVYNKNMSASAVRSFKILHQLRQALNKHLLYLVFQPKIALSTGCVTGIESLVRWNCDGRTILPDDFIPVAEASTLIHYIGALVLEETCSAIETLDAAGAPLLRFSINVSGRQFSDASLITTILDVLKKRKVSPERIELEVTETATMESFETVSAALRAFRNAGGAVAIDDFGTGYSSLKYLKELPASALKIDRSFVAEVDVGHDSCSIAAMVIQLARSLGMQVVAEGVENEAQANWLREHDCDLGQGWFYGRPMPLESLVDWLRERGCNMMPRYPA